MSVDNKSRERLIECAKKQRQDISLLLADQVSVFQHQVCHHVEVNTIRIILVVTLVYTIMKHVGMLPYLLDST